MDIEPYNSTNAQEWNCFVKESRNGTFLFEREYMDYHSDRFTDNSLILRNDKGKIIALLPANREGKILYSHHGLTYGGWILGQRHPNTNTMLEGWQIMTEYLRKNNIEKIIYNPVPHIYHKYPSEEDIYALYRNGGKLTGCLVSSVIDLRNPLGFNKGTHYSLTKANKAAVSVSESNDFLTFWLILTKLLKDKYSAAPVHTLEEITLLQNRFPRHIRLYAAYEDNEMTAGVVIYHTGIVSHCQYIAATPRGQQTGALPKLFSFIIGNIPAGTRYFDFGTSNEDNGNYLNSGLLAQKAGFGARAIACPRFEIELR